MAPSVEVLDEPLLEFRHGQRLEDPRDGLGLFGPFDADGPAHPGQVARGVVGHAAGIEAFDRFSEALSRPVLAEATGDNRRLWRPFPGFDAAFEASWPSKPAWVGSLDRDALVTASTHGDPHQRAFEVVNQYLAAIEVARMRDERVGVVFCVVPEEVWLNCRPQSRVKKRTTRGPSRDELRLRRMGQRDLFATYDPKQYGLSVDFRRQLKARTMKFRIPIQIIRETTLALSSDASAKRSLTPLSDRAWNLTTTAYYKAGGKPWKLANARDGVCYIGLAFRRADTEKGSQTACCAAQMFLDSGDGVVFKGEYGPWYSPERNEYHLKPEAAEELLRGVLHTYAQLDGKPLREIFLHSRSTILGSEFAGYQAACPSGVKLVGVRVRQEDIDGAKLFREGTRPVLRGTFWRLNNTTGFLWGGGFMPSLLSYPGWSVPRPLRIDIEHGEADVSEVARDILGLTKLNYNACRVGDSEPVTVGFSDAVGEILVANPDADGAAPQFSYYI